MEYRRFGNKIVARMDKGEEICAKLLELAEAEDIRLASVSGIGASNDVTLGVFNPYIKEYSQQRYWMSYYELASVTGTLSRKDGEPYLHLHAVIGQHQPFVFRGLEVEDGRRDLRRPPQRRGGERHL